MFLYLSIEITRVHVNNTENSKKHRTTGVCLEQIEEKKSREIKLIATGK